MPAALAVIAGNRRNTLSLEVAGVPLNRTPPPLSYAHRPNRKAAPR
ncbi:hypothetical protein D8I24_0608 [Cupriavidus necator H850]|nr:hypothetical protein D8I24_0608 [Cupriavidus necator H850]